MKREVQILHHLGGHPNITLLKGAYEDKYNVHLVMELCSGGELFDRIVSRGHYRCRRAVSVAHQKVPHVRVSPQPLAVTWPCAAGCWAIRCLAMSAHLCVDKAGWTPEPCENSGVLQSGCWAC